MSKNVQRYKQGYISVPQGEEADYIKASTISNVLIFPSNFRSDAYFEAAGGGKMLLLSGHSVYVLLAEDDEEDRRFREALRIVQKQNKS